eukprot:66759_1
MGNKNAYQGNKDPYTYTSIGDTVQLFKPLKYFLSADNNACIVVGEKCVAYFDYDCKSNEFNQTLSTSFGSTIKDVIYNPYHQLLIFWTNNSKHITTCSLKPQSIKSVVEHDINIDIKSTIISVHFAKKCECLILFTRIGNIIIMKWDNISNKYKYTNECILQHCEQIIACDIHESRRKMVLITKYKQHWYLNIYSIKQMLIAIDEKQIIPPVLCVSRLIFWDIKRRNSVIKGFKELFPKLFNTFEEIDERSQNYIIFISFERSNGYYERIACEASKPKFNGVKYVLDTFFGINPADCKLLFNYYGDKVLFQSNKTISVNSYDGYGGYLNDFGPLHIIDINTGHSLYSVGSKASDKGIAWTLTDHLIVYRCNYLNSKCKFNLEGFESQTNIAECLYNIMETKLDSFSWDLCLLIAVYRGSERCYKEIILVKRDKKIKNEFEHLTTRFND